MSEAARGAGIRLESVSTPAAVATVARLAREIWYDHYEPIIGRVQVDYMVPRFQSEAAISAQQKRGLEYFLLFVDSEPVGYFAIEPQPADASLFLSKFYVLKQWRGCGIARHALAFIEASGRERSLSLLWLTVNKFNPALGAYERLGFRNVAAVVTDIGAGFVMDDYRLEKPIIAS